MFLPFWLLQFNFAVSVDLFFHNLNSSLKSFYCETSAPTEPAASTSQWSTLVLLSCRTHHASVQVLVHATEGVRCHLALAGQQQCDVGDAQRVEGLRVQRPAVGQEDPVGGGGAAGAEAGGAAVGRGLDDVPALLQLLLPFIQDPEDTSASVSTLNMMINRK